MIYRTFGDLKLQLEQEMDTEGEEFVGEAELRNYFNSGIIMLESNLIKLGLREKYLQGEAFVSTITGQADYDLPPDIVINKIRKIVYRNMTNAYTLQPVRTEESYACEDNLTGEASEYYKYALYKIGNIQKIRLIPTPRIAIPGALRVIYFKSLQRFTVDSDLCDLPDVGYEALLSYVRYRVYAKESHVNTPDEKQNLSTLVGMFIDTMQNQVADPDIEMLDQDFSHYSEMN